MYMYRYSQVCDCLAMVQISYYSPLVVFSSEQCVCKYVVASAVTDKHTHTPKDYVGARGGWGLADNELIEQR